MANPAGYVQLFDSAAPRLIGGKAIVDTSGGEFMFASGAANVVSSGANSFTTADLTFHNDASGGTVNGVAVFNVDSGGEVVIATRGTIITVANGDVVAGTPVSVDGGNAVAEAGSVDGNIGHQRVVGRALTEVSSGGYCLVHLNL